MPVFMDRHFTPGISLLEALKVHEMDVSVQDRYDCRCHTFWIDEQRGYVNCLVEAPDEEAVRSMHTNSHGELPATILEVHSDLVMAFLGRVQDLPEESAAPVDSSFRCIMFTDLKDSTSMTTRLGDTAAMELIRTHDSFIRGVLTPHRGREVKHTGDGFMLSFPLVADAVLAACDIQDRFAAYNAGRPEVPLRVRIGIAGGEPVVEGTDLFGRAVQMAARLCAIAEVGEILAQSELRPLCTTPRLDWGPDREVSLKGFDAPVRVAPVQRGAGA